MNEAGPTPPAPTPAELSSAVASLHWWHHIDLGRGIVTPGTSNIAHQAWISQLLPLRFDGLSVLDIGAWDGYYSFLAEERGARRVVALDRLQNEQAHGSGTRPFQLARAARRSNVEYRVGDVLDAEQLKEEFDVVLFLGVYYHLREPWKALEAIRRRVSPKGRVFLEGLLLPGARPLLRFFHPPELEETTYCAATESGLTELARLAGFGATRTLSLHRGWGMLPFRFWKWLPRTMKFGGCLNPSSPSARFVTRTRFLDGAWPRIVMELRAA